MKLFLSLILLLTSALAHAAAPPSAPDALRSLATLPRTSAEIGFAISTQTGFALGGEPIDLSKLKPASERLPELLKSRPASDPDPEHQYNLASLYAELGQKAKSIEHLERSVRAFQARLDSTPDDGWTRVQLAWAHNAAGRSEQAEQLFRSATTTSPGDWRCWQALAQFLSQRVMTVFSHADSSSEQTENSTVTRSVPRPELKPEELANARRHHEEARSCYNRSVDVAPDNPDALAARCVFRWVSVQLIEPTLYPGKSVTSVDQLWRVLADGIDDLKRLAKLTTNDPYAIGAAAMFEAMARAQLQSPEQMLAGDVWQTLPDASRTYIRESITRLNELAENSDPIIAAGSCASLAAIQFLLVRDLPAAETNLRRAINLNPAPNNASEMLLLMFVLSERWNDFVELCQTRIKHKLSPMLHFKLSKGYEKLGKTELLEPELLSAIRLDPNTHLYQLGLMSVQLRTARTDEAFAAIGRSMGVWKHQHLSRATREDALQFEFLHAIYFGLSGNRDEAMKHAEMLVAADPENPAYKQLKNALSQ